jgi:hypothetical protein
VNHSSRDSQGLADVEGLCRLAFDLILQRPFEDVDDLFTRMRVLDQWRFRADVDARLDHLASWDAEILLLQIGAPQSRPLLDRPTRMAPPRVVTR